MPLDLNDIGLRLIEFDPTRPQPSFFSTATQFAAATAAGLRADPVQFPGGFSPALDTPAVAPSPSDPLPKADVVIVTWTVAEADTLARLMTPGIELNEWFEYKSQLDHYIPIVNGKKAPFNSPKSQRYFKSLGIYYPITLVGKKVICIKSGLHLDHDSQPPFPGSLPMMDWWKQVLAETEAEFIITTGTGGAIGADVLLGDVVIAAQTVFDCTTQFAAEPFHDKVYDTSPLPGGWTPPAADLVRPNAQRVAQSDQPSHPDGLPAFFYAGSTIAKPKIVTTDRFAFDNTTNSAGLQALGNVCDMGDASLGFVIAGMGNDAPLWAAIRNASDPQIDGALPPKDQGGAAENIYKTYGGLTSAASVLASWSLICARYAPAPPPAAEFLAAHPVLLTLEKAQRESKQVDPTHLLMQLAASSDLKIQDVASDGVAPETLATLKSRLSAVNVDPAQSETKWRSIQYTDETLRRYELMLAQVANDGIKSFRGSYLLMGPNLISKEEFGQN